MLKLKCENCLDILPTFCAHFLCVLLLQAERLRQSGIYQEFNVVTVTSSLLETLEMSFTSW